MRRLACDPNLEVYGQAALSLTENIRAAAIVPILQKYGLSQIEPDEWYPAQNFLNVIGDIAQQPEFMGNLIAVGLALAAKAILLPQIETLDQLMNMYDLVYQANHRNGDAGHIIAKQVEEQCYKITLTDIYPDDITYGSIYGFAVRLLPKGADFSVKYDNPLTTRDRDGTETIIHLQWD